MQQEFYTILTLTGVTILGAAVYYVKNGGEGAKPPPTNDVPAAEPKMENTFLHTGTGNYPNPERLLLATASDIWTDKVIPLSVACTIWAESIDEQKREIACPAFDHEEIKRFYMEVVEQKKAIYGKKKATIIAILTMLDRYGNCPSVVRNPKHPDAENKYSEDVFTMLGEIPLYEHSLAVATSMAQRVGRDTLLPDALIVSLGHDIGKIPDYHEKGYSAGDHPIISSLTLNGIKEYSALSNKTDLDQIVRKHHDLNPAHPMAALLKECDQITRNAEISGKMKQAVQATRNEEAQTQAVPETKTQQSVEVQQGKPETTSFPQPSADPSEQKDHPLGLKETGKDAKYTPERIDIPWFNPDAMLTMLKDWINVVAQGRWGAVSMPDGIVYVNGDCLWGVVKKTAPEDTVPMLLSADADEATKRNLLFSIVWTLSEQRQGTVAADMIHPDYYMIPVTIISGSGKPITSPSGSAQLMTPFRAEAFGVLPSELENTKTAVLRKMVKTIKPINQERQ